MSNQFYATIKSMEDILRNGISILTVNDAFQEITNLLLLKLIEKDITSGKINELGEENNIIKIDEECILSNIYTKYCVNYDEKIKNNKIKRGDLYRLLYDEKRHIDRYYNNELDAWIEKDTEDYTKLCVFKKIFHHKTLSEVYSGSWKKYFKFEESHEPDIIKCISKLVEGFNMEINNTNSDFLGDAFEKYRDGIFGIKSGLGQYFTSQYIIEKILNEVELKPTDKLYDPACGAGGFFIKAKKYVQEKYGNKKSDKFSSNNVFGHEVDPNIFKVLQLNSYIYGFKLNNFQLCNSITSKDSYQNNKYDVLAYNPPFGGSFESNSPEMFPIKIKNSVGLFLQLGFKALKEDGRCGVVVDQGIINNGTEKTTSWESKIRKELLKNGLKKIVLLPTGAFQYTDFAICVLIYDKTYKDKKIIYEEGYFKDEDKGTRIKPMYFKNIGEVSYEQVEKNKYSLKYDDYFKVVESNKQDKTGWVKLGDLCETKGGIKFKLEQMPSEKKSEYIYLRGQNLNDVKFRDNNYVYLNYYDKKFESYKINKNELYYILVGSIGICGISEIDCYMSGNICSLFNFEKFNFNKKFVMYYLIFNKPIKESNAQPNISRDFLKNILIPNLPLSHQEEIVKFLDEYFSKHSIDEFNEYLGNFNVFKLLIDKNYGLFNKLQSYILMIKESEKLIEEQNDWKHEAKKKYLKQIKQGYDIITVYNNNQSIEDMNFVFNNMIKTIITLENIPRMKNLQIQSIFQSYRPQCEIKKLGDIVEDLKCGKSISKANLLEKGYPYFGANGIIGYTDSYLYNGEYILVARNGTIGAVHKFNGKFYPSDHTFVVNPKNVNINYIFKYLTECVKWKSLSVHNGMPGITKPILENIQIPVPPLEVQEEIIKRIEALDVKSSHYNQYAQMLQTELDNISDIINNMTTACKDNEQSIDESNDEANDETNDEPTDEANESDNKSNIEAKIEQIIDDANDEDNDKSSKKSKKKSSKKVKKIETIEIKGKTYILEEDKVFKIDDDGNKGKQYGTYLDGKVKKLKSEEKEVSI